MHVIISLMKLTLTSNKSLLWLCSLISAELIPIKVVSFLSSLVDLSLIASLNELYTSLFNKVLISLIFPLAKDVIIVS